MIFPCWYYYVSIGDNAWEIFSETTNFTSRKKVWLNPAVSINVFSESLYLFIAEYSVFVFIWLDTLFVSLETFKPLQWRHNGCDGVSNHQPHHRLLNRLIGRRSKKTAKLRATGLCEGNSPVTGEFPAQMASNAEMFPFDDHKMTFDVVSLLFYNPENRNNSSTNDFWHSLKILSRT